MAEWKGISTRQCHITGGGEKDHVIFFPAPSQETLLPLINKDLPTLYAVQFQNSVLGPGVVLQFLSHFIFIFSIED
jgi:hypothetical protein